MLENTQILIIYLVAINVVTFFVYGLDKLKAKRRQWRIPEAVLLTLAVIGGSVGAWLGMKVWHHKTAHNEFRFGIPLIIVAQIALFFLVSCGRKYDENKPQKETTDMKNEECLGKVIGIGGVFFKSQDPEKTKQWYEDHLGIENGPFGHVFTWYHDKQGATEGQTVWTPFEANTDYFGDNDMMINYIVDDMDAIVARLREEGVTFVDEVTEYEGLGKFVHIEDGEGRRVELWGPAK